MDRLKFSETRTARPNWKQWIPIYGIYQVYRDLRNEKPTVIDCPLSVTWFCSGLYQAVAFTSASEGILSGLSRLVEKSL